MIYQKKYVFPANHFFWKNGWLETQIFSHSSSHPEKMVGWKDIFFSEKSSLPEKMVGWKVIFFLIRHVTQEKMVGWKLIFFSFVKSSRKNGWLESHIFSDTSCHPEKKVGWKLIFFLICHVTQKKWLAGNSYFFSLVKSSRKNGWLESHIFSEKSSHPEKMVGWKLIFFLIRQVFQKKWLAGKSNFFSFVKSSRKNGWLESHIFSGRL